MSRPAAAPSKSGKKDEETGVARRTRLVAEARARLSPEDRLLSAVEVAARLGLKLPTVRELANDGVLPGVVRIGRLLRFDPTALATFRQKGGKAFGDGWRRSPAEQRARKKR